MFEIPVTLGVKNASAQVKLVRELREIRKLHGISVAEVAKAMDVDPAMIYRFEKAETNFTMSTLRKYAKAVDAELSFTAMSARAATGPGMNSPTNSAL